MPLRLGNQSCGLFKASQVLPESDKIKLLGIRTYLIQLLISIPLNALKLGSSFILRNLLILLWLWGGSRTYPRNTMHEAGIHPGRDAGQSEGTMYTHSHTHSHNSHNSHNLESPIRPRTTGENTVAVYYSLLFQRQAMCSIISSSCKYELFVIVIYISNHSVLIS